jgi:hypothetical protein
LHVSDNHDSDGTLQTEASIGEHATPAVLPEVEIDNHDDLNDDLGDQGDEDSPIDIDIGDLIYQMTDEDRLDMATQNWLMLDMLFENQVQ